jgi:hypothetical protein
VAFRFGKFRTRVANPASLNIATISGGEWLASGRFARTFERRIGLSRRRYEDPYRRLRGVRSRSREYGSGLDVLVEKLRLLRPQLVALKAACDFESGWPIWWRRGQIVAEEARQTRALSAQKTIEISRHYSRRADKSRKLAAVVEKLRRRGEQTAHKIVKPT